MFLKMRVKVPIPSMIQPKRNLIFSLKKRFLKMLKECSTVPFNFPKEIAELPFVQKNGLFYLMPRIDLFH